MNIEKICSEIFMTPLIELENDFQLTNFDTWDSMTHIFLIERIESEFNVQFSGDEIADIKSIGDIRNLIKIHRGLT